MRGAADSFGVVLSFYLQTSPAPETVVNWSFSFPNLLRNIPNMVTVFNHLQDFALNSAIIDRRIGFGIVFNQDMEMDVIVRGSYMGSIEIFNNTITPWLLQGLPTPSSRSVEELDWITALKKVARSAELIQPTARKDYHDHDNFYAKSLTLNKPLTNSTLTDFFQYIQDEGSKPPTSW